MHRLAEVIGGDLGSVHGKRGKYDLDRKIAAYNQAAQYSPWFVLRDMDHDDDCAASLRNCLLPESVSQMCFRIAVRSVEAWLLADRSNIASFLSVSVDLVPRDPEAMENPKVDMVNLARRSKRRAIREDMIPRPGSGRHVGPAYTARMIEFARQHWRPDVASGTSDSLRRAILCWEKLLEGS